jgi:hypothetical protein
VKVTIPLALNGRLLLLQSMQAASRVSIDAAVEPIDSFGVVAKNDEDGK